MMTFLKLILLIPFAGIFLFALYTIGEEISIDGLRAIRKKSFTISLIAFGFSLFLLFKLISDLL
jgi:hypothetical protein